MVAGRQTVFRYLFGFCGGSMYHLQRHGGILSVHASTRTPVIMLVARPFTHAHTQVYWPWRAEFWNNTAPAATTVGPVLTTLGSNETTVTVTTVTTAAMATIPEGGIPEW